MSFSDVNFSRFTKRNILSGLEFGPLLVSFVTRFPAMNLRYLFAALILLLATVALLFVGGLGEVDLLTARDCGPSTYLCEPPPIVSTQPNLTYSALLRAEHRVGLR
jgi:hypothetical protein